MMVDDALKGTTYGAALEAAERDIAAKRETKGLDPQIAARLAAEEIRQAQLLTKAVRPSLASATPFTRPTDQEIVALLTRAQIRILETGHQRVTFPLSRWQVSTAAIDLLAWHLIVRHGIGAYSLTVDGRRVYALWAEVWAPTPVPPTTALTPTDSLTDEETDTMTDTTISTPLSPTQIRILAQGHEAIPFRLDRSVGRALGKMLDDKLMAPTTVKGEWTLTDKGRSAYAIHLAQQAAAADQVYKDTESQINRDDPALRPGPFESLTAMSAISMAAEERLATIRKQDKTIDDLNALIDEQAKEIKTLKANTPLVTTGINWYERVIAPLIDLIAQYDGEEARLRIESDPGLIVQGVTSLRRALDKVKDTTDTARLIVDALMKMMAEDDSGLTVVAYVEALRKTAASADQAARQVEALRRQLDQAHLDLQIADRHAALHEIDEFLVCVLDEMAQADPLIETIRDSRVMAQRALMQLKARVADRGDR